MAKSKIIYGNTVLMDLTSDTVEADKLLRGYTAHGADGELVTGTCDFDVDSSDATATAGEILAGETAGVNGQIITGTMPNRGAVTGTIDDISTPYVIQNGYHDGSGTVDIDATEKAKIIGNNIRSGVEILGVTGTMDPASEITSQAKTVEAYTTAQTVLPDSGVDYLSQVTVNAIYYNETPNAAGGITVTVGRVAP